MRAGIRAELKGRRLAQKKMMQMVKDLQGGPMLKAMRDSTLMVQRDAKKLAPVDTGRLRASITPSVKGGDPVQGVVGSNVKYAPFMELGTKAHFPPVSAIAGWVHRKKIAGIYSIRTRRRLGGKATQESQDLSVAFAIAQRIAQKGLAARRYLQGAFEKNAPRIVRKLGDAVAEITRRAN